MSREDDKRDPLGLGPRVPRLPQPPDLLRRYVKHLEAMLKDARADLAESEAMENAGIN